MRNLLEQVAALSPEAERLAERLRQPLSRCDLSGLSRAIEAIRPV